MKNSFRSSLELTEVLTPLDWTIFFLVLLATFSAIVYGEVLKKRSVKENDEKESLLDLLIMGRRLTLPLFIATLVATWYGGIFGVTRIAFEKGIYNFITQGFFWYIAYFIFALFLVDKIAPYQAVTLPDLIGKMFGPKSAKLCGVFNFFNVLPIAYTISLGLFLQGLFGGTLVINMLIGISVVVVYSMFGGLRAVIFSDLVQFFVMCLGVLLVVVFSVINFGGYGFLKESLPATHFSLTGGVGFGTTLVWGFIALSTLVDPNFYQRCFAAKSTRVAKRGILISILVWFAFDICTTLGGMYARAVIPESEPASSYLIYAIQVLPAGVRGLVLAGILATILSTLDSYLFLAGTTITYDLLPKRWHGRVNLHYLGIIVVGIIAIFMGTLFEGNIKTVWKTLGSYSASCLLFPVLYAYAFPKKLTDNQFVLACLFGVVGTTYWRNAEHAGFWANVDELYIGVFCTLFGLLFFPLLSRLGEKGDVA